MLLAVSADGRTLAFCGKENTAVLTEMDTGKKVGKLGRRDEWVSGAAFTPDGRTLITSCNDHTAHVWDVKSAHELRKFEFADVQPQPGAGQPSGLHPRDAPTTQGPFCAWQFFSRARSLTRLRSNLPLPKRAFRA